VHLTGGRLVARREVVLGGPGGGEGTLRMAGGTLRTERLRKGGPGGRFDFAGGKLHAAVVGFDLVSTGGALAPGDGIGHTEILGDLGIEGGGALEIDLDERASDTVGVRGRARLGGALRVEWRGRGAPRDGQSWTILVAGGGITGRFTSVPAGYGVRIDGDRLVLVFGAEGKGMREVVARRYEGLR
jgi:hypothetical protein